jgi:hypothetical protein
MCEYITEINCSEKENGQEKNKRKEKKKKNNNKPVD